MGIYQWHWREALTPCQALRQEVHNEDDNNVDCCSGHIFEYGRICWEGVSDYGDGHQCA